VFYSRTSEETRNDFGIDYILIELSISHFTSQFISNVFYNQMDGIRSRKGSSSEKNASKKGRI